MTEDYFEKAKVRWRNAKPDGNLTWGTIMNAKLHLATLRKSFSFTDQTEMLEIGFGYGRIIKEVLENAVPFKRYVGIDISEQNTNYCREKFTDPRLTFKNLDAEMPFQFEPFDLCFSFATFKHLYPTWDNVLMNVLMNIKKDGYVIFDLLFGQHSECTWESHTFDNKETPNWSRRYTDHDIDEILKNHPVTITSRNIEEVEGGSKKIMVLRKNT